MHTIEDYRAFLDSVRKQTGIESLVPDDSGLVSVRIDDAFNMNLQFVEATEKILCFVEVAELPVDVPKAVYRDLLVGGLFGKDTAGGYFSVEPNTETVVYNYYFDFDKAANDIEDFVSALEKIMQLCDIWAERIKGIGNSEEVRGNGDEWVRVKAGDSFREECDGFHIDDHGPSYFRIVP